MCGVGAGTHKRLKIVSRTNKSESRCLGPVIHAISSTQECHPTHFASIGGYFPMSYAVEALLGPSQLHNGAHSSSKWALRCISQNLDGTHSPCHFIRHFNHSGVSSNPLWIYWRSSTQVICNQSTVGVITGSSPLSNGAHFS